METNITPEAIAQPFANNGDRNDIPSASTGTNLASLTEGFPPITSQSILSGGIPPTRKDFNALGYLATTQSFYAQNGGLYTFNTAVSQAIGGYPLGAVLSYVDSAGNLRWLKSLKANNTDNFNADSSVIGTSWEDTGVYKSYVDDNFQRLDNLSQTIDSSTTKYPSDNAVKTITDTLQSNIDAKQTTITGGASTITSSNLTASRALISNSSGKVAVSDITATELNYLDGVTSNIQTQLDAKQASGSYVTTNTEQTITGVKTFRDKFFLQEMDVEYNVAPATNHYLDAPGFLDKNGQYMGSCACVRYTNGFTESYLNVRKPTGTWMSILLGIGSTDKGVEYTKAPPSELINSIVTTTGIRKSGNGYVKLGNGIIIQWGNRTLNTGSTTINLPTPFSFTGYSVAAIRNSGETTTKSIDFWLRSPQLTTSFNIYSVDIIGIRWIAIGY